MLPAAGFSVVKKKRRVVRGRGAFRVCDVMVLGRLVGVHVVYRGKKGERCEERLVGVIS